MHQRQQPLITLIMILTLLTVAITVHADLGQSEAAAKSKAAHWKAKYGAIQPLFETSGGKVVQECWQAPAAMWSKSTALAFASELVPVDGEPKFVEKDGLNLKYSLGDYVIVLSTFDGQAIGVQVQVKSFNGYDC